MEQENLSMFLWNIHRKKQPLFIPGYRHSTWHSYIHVAPTYRIMPHFREQNRTHLSPLQQHGIDLPGVYLICEPLMKWNISLFLILVIWCLNLQPKHLNIYELCEIVVVKSWDKFGFILSLLSLLFVIQVKWHSPERNRCRNALCIITCRAHLYQECAKK